MVRAEVPRLGSYVVLPFVLKKDGGEQLLGRFAIGPSFRGHRRNLATLPVQTPVASPLLRQ